MSRRRVGGARLLATALAFAALPSVGMAQVQTGSILVRVFDEQGGVLPGATVTISSPVLVGSQMTGVTDAGGAYRFPSLPPGDYTVRLELQSFQTTWTRRSAAVMSSGSASTTRMPSRATRRIASTTSSSRGTARHAPRRT